MGASTNQPTSYTIHIVMFLHILGGKGGYSRGPPNTEAGLSTYVWVLGDGSRRDTNTTDNFDTSDETGNTASGISTPAENNGECGRR